jgi:hypothetical protein
MPEPVKLLGKLKTLVLLGILDALALNAKA